MSGADLAGVMLDLSAVALAGVVVSLRGFSHDAPPTDVTRLVKCPEPTCGCQDDDSYAPREPVRWSNQEWQRLHDVMAVDKAQVAQMRGER